MYYDSKKRIKDIKIIDEALLRNVLKSGTLEMATCKEIIEYITIAVEFWEHQKNIMKW